MLHHRLHDAVEVENADEEAEEDHHRHRAEGKDGALDGHRQVQAAHGQRTVFQVKGDVSGWRGQSSRGEVPKDEIGAGGGEAEEGVDLLADAAEDGLAEGGAEDDDTEDELHCQAPKNLVPLDGFSVFLEIYKRFTKC